MRETPKALAAFETYCSMGEERSLRKLANIIDTSLTQISAWSREHQWQERLMRYEHEQAEKKRKKREAEIDKMNERHALIGTTQQAKAIEQIKALIDAKAFGSMAAVQLLKLATDLERLARGTPTEITEHSGTIDLRGARERLLQKLETLPDDDDADTE